MKLLLVIAERVSRVFQATTVSAQWSEADPDRLDIRGTNMMITGALPEVYRVAPDEAEISEGEDIGETETQPITDFIRA